MSRIFISIIIGFIFPTTLFCQSASVKSRNDSVVCAPIRMIPEEELAFKGGEKLSYVIQYRWLGIRTDVGKATVNLSRANDRDGRSVFHSKAVGSTFKFWDSFFKVRDFYETKFYADNIRPIYFHRDINEGDYTMKNTYYWNDSDNSIQAQIVRMSREPIDTILPGLECTYDLLTLFYQARNLNFDSVGKGVNHPLSFAIDEEIFNIYFRYIGKENKKIPKLGTYKTMKFAAKVVAGEVFKGEQEMFIWVTDDKNKIPLLFESPIIVGTVIGRLTEYDNIKFPMECKIK